MLFSATLTSPPGANGEGSLAEISFHVVGVGQTPLKILETTLKDPEGNLLSHTTFDGLFSNVLVALESTIDFIPPIINQGVKKQLITCYIELPEGYKVSDIDVTSIRLNDTLQIDMTAPTKIGDYDADSILDLKVQFNRTAILQMVKAKGVKIGNVTLSLQEILSTEHHSKEARS